METNKLQINLDLLPKVLQEELFNYYQYLLKSYQQKSGEKYKMKQFFSTVNENKFDLPKNYKFNRDLANERNISVQID